MFQIKIDLINDLYDEILKDVSYFKSFGFYFPEYKDWELSEISKIDKRISELNKEGKDTTKELENKSFDQLQKNYNRHLIYIYSNLREKLIPQIPREIQKSSAFACPAQLNEGLINLENKIIKGESLLPHLSRKIFISDQQDGMLFDFNIYHLHLGIKPDKKYPQLVEGKDEILYCMFDNEYCYYLVIGKHGRWADLEILRIVKNEFPHLLKSWKVEGILGLSRSISESDRLHLRKHSINSMIEIDGEYYVSPGGGINGAGGSSKAVINMNGQYHYYKNIEKQIINLIENNKEDIEAKYALNDNSLTLKCINIPSLEFYDKTNNIKCYVKLSNDRYNVIEISLETQPSGPSYNSA